MINYSAEDLILYLYKETSAATTNAIEKILPNSWALREKLSVLKTSMERLDNIVESPRTESVLAILKYAAEKKPVSSID
ncbi:hypothetical protein V9K67_25595 [Paraflavisolibacter sp. H34]|uniref:hypothetical protein n=1 Tax=Huijunlia imazamoxiresistens TaxID=3127457 RepID=UPI003017AD2C